MKVVGDKNPGEFQQQRTTTPTPDKKRTTKSIVKVKKAIQAETQMRSRGIVEKTKKRKG